jgi:hypothetical protein
MKTAIILNYKKEKLIIAFLLSVFFIQGIYTINSLSPTFDESIHLTAGYCYWKRGDYQIAATVAPLSELIGAAPLLFLNPHLPDENSGWQGGTQYDYAFNFLFKNRLDASLMLNSGRIMMLLFGVLLGYLVYCWAKEIYGIKSGLFSLFLYSFCPSILANTTLVTADFTLTLFFFLSVYSIFKLFSRYSLVFVVLSGVFTGLTLASKHSASILFPVIGLISIIELWRNRRCLIWRKIFFGGLIFAFSMFFVLCIAYQFVNIKYFFIGLQKVFHKVYASSYLDYFLMGRYSKGGWWYYFLVGFIIKTPIPLIIFVLISIWNLLKLFKNNRLGNVKVLPYIFIAPVLFLIIASFSKFQIGHRHILPIYPFLFIGAGSVIKYFDKKALKAAIILLCAWYVFSVVKVSPYYISYFNEFVGGPANGYKYLVDSNLDWGQGLKSLGKYLHKENIRNIYLSYFGTADPCYYGIRYKQLGFVANTDCLKQQENADIKNERRTLLVVSATNLQGVYYRNHEAFAWLKNRTPVKLIANSLFVYDITDDADAHRQIGNLLLAAGDRQGYEEEYLWAGRIEKTKTDKDKIF